MKPKYRGWKEGVIAETVRSVGGGTHRKGDKIRYRVYKVYKVYKVYVSRGEWNTYDKEYHVLDLNNSNLIRTPALKIEGVELVNFREEYCGGTKQGKKG